MKSHHFLVHFPPDFPRVPLGVQAPRRPTLPLSHPLTTSLSPLFPQSYAPVQTYHRPTTIEVPSRRDHRLLPPSSFPSYLPPLGLPPLSVRPPSHIFILNFESTLFHHSFSPWRPLPFSPLLVSTHPVRWPTQSSSVTDSLLLTD